MLKRVYPSAQMVTLKVGARLQGTSLNPPYATLSSRVYMTVSRVGNRLHLYIDWVCACLTHVFLAMIYGVPSGSTMRLSAFINIYFP